MKIDKNPHIIINNCQIYSIDQYIANSSVININQIELIDLYYERYNTLMFQWYLMIFYLKE